MFTNKYYNCPCPRPFTMVTEKTSAWDLLLKRIGRLGKPELLKLLDVITLLLQCWEEAENPDISSQPTRTQAKAAKGYIEWKTIPRNGKAYGPYPYLRYLDKGVYKSIYLKHVLAGTKK